MSPPPSVHRLAGVRYQLSRRVILGWVVGNGRPQEDPQTLAICRKVLTPLVHRFQTDGIQRTRGRSSAEHGAVGK